MDHTATFEAYMLFRMNEAEHIQKAYNGEINSSVNVEENGITEAARIMTQIEYLKAAREANAEWLADFRNRYGIVPAQEDFSAD